MAINRRILSFNHQRLINFKFQKHDQNACHFDILCTTILHRNQTERFEAGTKVT